jgi:hypothetical protein
MTTFAPSWYQKNTYPSYLDGIADAAISDMQFTTTGGGPMVHTWNIYGAIPKLELFEFADKLLEITQDLRQVRTGWATHDETRTIKSCVRTFVSEDCVLSITLNMGLEPEISVVLATTNLNVLHKISQFVLDNTTNREDSSGSVYALVNTKNGPEVQFIGTGGFPLEKGNYSAEVIKGYEKIIKDLNAKNPSGKIAILDGEPGSGKSYMIRGLLHEVDAVFVIVSPDMVEQLTSPAMISSLLKVKKNSSSDKSIVLIVEDADSLLSQRMSDNMSGISSILNLGDGIMGSVLNVRLVCTTNAKKVDLDPAILRPGRLSANVHVGALSREEAQAALTRLSPDSILPENSSKFTIAQVYEIARQGGWEPTASEESSIGFKNSVLNRELREANKIPSFEEES